MDRQRVVITGLGTVNPLANSIKEYWRGLINGRSGIDNITQFDATEMPCKIAGEVKDFDPHEYLDRKTARRLSRSTHLAVAAAHQAIEDAGLPIMMPVPERAGVLFGTGIAGLGLILDVNTVLKTKGYSRMNPYHLPAGIPNIPTFQIAQEFQCLGPNNTIATACAAGTQAVGEGAELIRRGSADIVIAGGAEAIVMPITIGGFSVMRAIPFNYNDNPQAASRPFDKNREGFVLSEGSGALILEALDHALEREARIYAEVLGHASSSDGHHMVAMKPDGMGPSRAMHWSLEDANVK
ncbi:MAG: beta-ketoacyl synthase N-terminal-like domain-containing protein, partial [Anaerolineales bacterium]